MPSLSGHHIERRLVGLTGLVLAAALLQLAAGVGIAYVAGFGAVRDALLAVRWPYLVAMLGGFGASFVGYYYAYRGVYRVEDGPTLSGEQLRAVVTAGFGGFLAHGGAALDTYALEAAGADPRDASVRVSCLAGLEHGVLSLLGTVAAIAMLVQGLGRPPLDFTLPWAVIPVPGFLLAFWLAERHRERFRDQQGWRHKVGIFLDSIHLIRTMFRYPGQYGYAPLGMAGFWLAEAFTAWAAVAAFGYRMDPATFYVGFGTGMVFTRRTGPNAGAGILDLVLPVTVWYSGAPFGVAVAGLLTYRIVSLWLPMPFALGRLRTLRAMGRPIPHAEGTAEPQGEPALQPEDG